MNWDQAAQRYDLAPDADKAGRLVFRAREKDAHNARAWAARCRGDETWEAATPEPKPRAEPAPFDSIGWGYAEAAGLLDADYVSEQRDISTEDRRFAFSAHGEFVALCKEHTGDTMPDDKLRERARAAAELLTQSHAIAEKMRGAGFNCYRETPFELVRYYMHSRQIESLPSFRRSCFIPYVAQAIRAPMLAALEFFLEKNPFCRFWTFSSGLRVRLSMIRERAQWMHAKLKELNAQPFMKEAGARLVFRATELGTPETNANGDTLDGGEIERDDDGQLLFHVHAHVVVELTKGFVAPKQWAALVGKVGAFWPAWWGEGGAIRNARECCKYVTKPGEMLKLDGAELVALQEQLFRLKLVQPMGSLAAEIKARETEKKRLVRKRTPEGAVYFAVKDWNKHGRRTRMEETADAAAKLTPAAARGAVRVVSRGLPRFGAAGVAEPVATVMFMRGSWNEATVRAHALIAPVIRATVHEYFAGVAIRVHTRTPTVGASPAPRPLKPRGKPRAHRMSAASAGF